MFDFASFELSSMQWAMLALTAFLVGISKTGVPGIGIIAVPLIAIASDDAKASVGLLLPLLIFADLFAAGYYRRKANWGHIAKLIPWTLTGIATGYFALRVIDGGFLSPVIGGVVLIMLAMKCWQTVKKEKGQEIKVPSHWAFAAVLGFLAGLTTMMANAAGPVMIIYLLAMALPKAEFIGTRAWFFFIVNWIKVPLMVNLDIINAESLKLNATLFPLVAVGAVIGIFVLKYIPQKIFTKVVIILAAGAAIKLVLN
jgi:uncharacterized membrane protein YfcA